MNGILKCAALALLFCATAAQAQEGPQSKPPQGPDAMSGDAGERRGPPKMFGERMKKELGLTDEQFKKLEENRVSNMKKIAELRKDLRELRKSFGEEMGKSADSSKMKKIHSQIKELSAKMADVMFDGMLSVRKVLTPEQLAKFHERMGKMRDGGKRGMKGEEGMGMKGGKGMMRDGCDCPCMKGRRPPHSDGMDEMEPPDMGEEPDMAPPAPPKEEKK